MRRTVLDHLAAPIAFYRTREEVEERFAAAGLRDVQVSPMNNDSWRGVGRKGGA